MIITKKEWDYILQQEKGRVFYVKTDFGLENADVRIDGENVIFLGKYTIKLKEKIKDNFCYLVDNTGVQPLAFFSEETNRFYKLTPTNDWPTLSIGSVPMHRVNSPRQDTIDKIAFLEPIGLVLDTCMGLGYTAILASKQAKEVITFEKDKNVYDLTKINPLSRELFCSKNIEIIQKDIVKSVEDFNSNYFDCIIHDPPTFKLAPELFSQLFYSELYRILKKNGKIFHYTPLYKISHGYDFPSKIKKNLSKTGFKAINFSFQKGGIVCKK